MKPREIKKLTATLKAIADPTRRAIFDLVWNSKKKESISTITKEFKITRQGITKHLKILSQGNLIELKRIGRVTYCYAHVDALNRAENWLNQYSQSTELSTDSDNNKTANNQIIKGTIAKGNLTENTSENKLENTTEPIVQTEDVLLEKEKPEIHELSSEIAAETSDQTLATAEEKPQLLQMSIDPDDPGTPVKEEPLNEETPVKETKEKPIEVTENQLDIYGIRKEPKLDESNQQFELF